MLCCSRTRKEVYSPFYTSLLLWGHTSPQRCPEQTEQSWRGERRRRKGERKKKSSLFKLKFIYTIKYFRLLGTILLIRIKLHNKRDIENRFFQWIEHYLAMQTTNTTFRADTTTICSHCTLSGVGAISVQSWGREKKNTTTQSNLQELAQYIDVLFYEAERCECAFR